MTKTKRQLRAEAVERLNAMSEDPTFGNVARAIVGKPINGWEWKAALEDLLTDDDADDGSAPEKGVTTVRVSSDNGRTWSAPCAMGCEPDSREKLEADVRELLYDVWTEGWELGSRDAMGGKDRMCDALALLDRQAAITERNCKELVGAQAERIAELRVEIDELEAEVEKLRAKVRNQREQLTDAQDALERRNNGELKKQWKRQLAEVEAERDTWRERCGKMADAAHEALRQAGM